MYASISGNTEEVADILEEELVGYGVEVDKYREGSGSIPDLSGYDTVFFGTYTWEKGAVPIEVKDLIYDIGYKPKNVVVFGTGDTQFGGDDLFCLAVDKLVNFYSSSVMPLKIEQSPRGSQELVVKDWVKGLMTKSDAYRGQRLVS